MMQVLVLLVFIFLIFVLPTMLFKRYAGKRAEGMKATGARLGFRYAEKDDSFSASGFPGIALFQSGIKHHISHVMQRSDSEAEVSIFDFNYVTGTASANSQSAPNIQTVVCYKTSKMELPAFICKPHRFSDKIGGEWILKKFGYKEISLAGHPQFNRQHLLYGEDEAEIQRMLNRPEAAEFFANQKEVTAEGNGSVLIVYMRAKILSGSALTDLYYQSQKLFDSLMQASD